MRQYPVESQDTEEEDSGAYLRLVLRQLAKMPSLRRLSIAFFDTVTDATLAEPSIPTAMTKGALTARVCLKPSSIGENPRFHPSEASRQSENT